MLTTIRIQQLQKLKSHQQYELHQPNVESMLTTHQMLAIIDPIKCRLAFKMRYNLDQFFQ